jgi:hypothetical protein
MHILRYLVALGAVLLVAGVAFVGQADDSTGAAMARSAEKFLDSLDAKQRARAAFAFDADERFNWQFMRDRADKARFKGLPMADMNAEQKKAAIELLKTGTSPAGNHLAATIMSLESLVPENTKMDGPIRNPAWYFFAVFGKPSATGDWGWRLQGHHLSLNFTLEGGKVIATTPTFLGAEPAEVKSGPRKGVRPFADADDLGSQLFRSLDNGQRKVALSEQSFPKYRGGDKKLAAGEPLGLAAARMNEKQRQMLLALLHAYTDRFPADVAKTEWSALTAAGIDKLHFAYTGSVEPGQPHAYRIQGPTLLIEFLNEQSDSDKNPANHVHSVWRNPKGDFGLKNEYLNHRDTETQRSQEERRNVRENKRWLPSDSLLVFSVSLCLCGSKGRLAVYRSSLALLLCLGVCSGARATDLTRIDRSIAKEPVYKTRTPEYCLLVFGPEAKFRVWLVRDGDTLYVDRNGNGDLTEPGEKVTADARYSKPAENIFIFQAGDVRVGGLLHKDLAVTMVKLADFADTDEAVKAHVSKDPQARGYMVAIEMEIPGLEGRGAGGRVIQHSVFADYHGLLCFAPQPRDAPIIHLGGPLQMTLFYPQRLQMGQSVDVTLGVGTPGLGAGTMAYIFYDGVIPRSAYPRLEVTYPPARPGEAPLKELYELRGRC